MSRLPPILLLLVPLLAVGQDDFADLGRFAADNEALGSPAEDEQRVVFLGDSITAGWSRGMAEFFDGRPYINRGIGGQTTPQMLLRLRSDVVNLEPQAVVILAGTNDIAGNTGPATNESIQENLASMAELAAASDIRVVLASILPAEAYPWSPDVEPAFRILAINGWLERYADDNDHVYLDYYSAMVNDRGGLREEFTTDGVHVTPAGYAVMAELAEDAIDEALSRSREEAEDEDAEASANQFFRPLNGCSRPTSRKRPVRCD